METFDLSARAIIEVLWYLLPGFVASGAYFQLVPKTDPPSPFERVIQALIYTMFVQALVFIVRGALLFLGSRIPPVGVWTPAVQIVWSVVLAVGCGAFFAWATNSDQIHAWLRRIHVTQETASGSEWFNALARNKGYMVLHLKGDKPRRLMGWADEWPPSATHGHFVITNAQWLDQDGNATEAAGVERTVIPAADVEMLELMALATPTPKETDEKRKHEGIGGLEVGRHEGANSDSPASIPAGEGLNSSLTSPATPSRSTTTPAPEKVSRNQ